MKPNIIFFARDYQTELFLKLQSEKYLNIFVTLTISEKKIITKNGFEVAGCFEEEFDSLHGSEIPDSYLKTSFVADRFFGTFSLDERRLILSKEIRFWERIYEKYKPVAIINELVAIEIAEVMYIEAQKRNIKYFAWVSSPFEHRNFYWSNEADHSQLDDGLFRKLPDSDSIDFAKKYFNRINDDENLKPYYVSNLPSRYNISRIIKYSGRYFLSVIKSNILIRQNKYLKFYYFDKTDLSIKITSYFYSILRSYDKIQDNYEIVFYPLHYEPEASILYMSEYQEDQFGLIRNLAKCLTNSQCLVIKEHPQQPGMLLSNKYRQLRRQLSNVAYLPAEYPARRIIKKAVLTITQTSSAGWEALLLGKPVFVLGKVFYDKYPKINKFMDFNELKTLIHSKKYVYPDKDETIKYIAQVWSYCKEGNPFPNPGLYEVSNIKRIINAIEERLSEECSIR